MSDIKKVLDGHDIENIIKVKIEIQQFKSGIVQHQEICQIAEND